ncbi:MAG: RsmB/NOP family class I SAM-dependent RNA methyltransferase [Chlorobi bacterium]|nr:RsmB/NOP family class I SAM-dependent RNA methyltransferase [Chlorobiota bacterium]
MNPRSLLGHCTELLEWIERSRATPADTLTSHYARTHKYLGAKERRALSEIVFATLRTRNTAIRVFESLVASSGNPMPPSSVAALIAAISTVAPLWTGFDGTSLLNAAAHAATDLIETLATIYRDSTGQPLPDNWHHRATELLHDLDRIDTTTTTAYAACLPEWIVAHFEDAGMERSEIRSLGRALIEPAPLVLRVASLNQSRQSVITAFANEGLSVRPTQFSPDGIIVDHRVQLLDHVLYRRGIIEVQDEGSQLVAFALSPHERWRILDACAGAGGKALHLAAMQRDRGEIIASDIAPERLTLLRRRLVRHRLRSIRVSPIPRLALSEQRRLHSSFDAVLLDVPCSGLGTVRRAPEIKWRLHPHRVERLVTKQLRILETYAPFVRSGGILLYATCSLLHEENERVIERFLNSSNKFVPDPVAPVLAQQNIPLAADDHQWQLRLMPHQHGTDGFFIARLRRL